MIEMSTVWMRVAVALYSIGLLHAILTVLRHRAQLFRVALATFSVAVVVHAVSLVEETVRLRSLPLHNFFESASLCSFLIAVLFLSVYWRYRIESLSVLLFPLVFLMAMVGSLRAPAGAWSSPALRDAWLLVHVALVLLGYAALLVMAAASVLYLVHEQRLKSKRPSAFFDRLPPLGTLDELISWAMAIAFVLITLAVIVGSTWGFVEFGTRWIREPKIAISLVTWGFYLAMVWLRSVAGWRGRRAAMVAVAVVGCSALTWAAHVGLRSLFVR
jgi:ABC-type uncharacterized transport system permease subunit